MKGVKTKICRDNSKKYALLLNFLVKVSILRHE
jgi:hypothetical protein